MTSASIHAAEFRAAGTDLSERRRSGVSKGPLIDITAAPDTIGMDWGADGAVRIGAFTTIAAIAADARIAQAYPGLAAAAEGLATPQIRHLATLGGNLAQRSRCWYFRNPQFACLKKGGHGLSRPRRQSSLQRRLRSRPLRGAASLDHGGGAARLRGENLNRPAKRADDRRASWRRLQWRRRPRARARRNDPERRASTSGPRRARALQARHQPQPCGVAAGRSVCPRRRLRRLVPVHPHRRRRHCAGPAPPVASEAVLQGAPASSANIADAARQATAGARPLPMTGYKLDLLRGVVHDLLERLAT